MREINTEKSFILEKRDDCLLRIMNQKPALFLLPTVVRQLKKEKLNYD